MEIKQLGSVDGGTMDTVHNDADVMQIVWIRYEPV